VTATDKPAIAYGIFAAIALVFALLLARELYIHHLPFAVGVFAVGSAFLGVFNSLAYFWGAWRQAKFTVAEDQSAEH
jgi:hypothetical protein